ncbi:hypothetical protein MRR68_22685, partial [Aeromonas dhakensis]|nr:hypothetical protein [Aeromonas dhakensis]
RPHHCQLLLDQGPLRRTADYQPLTPAGCRLLLGTDYALLRPANRAASQAGHRRHPARSGDGGDGAAAAAAGAPADRGRGSGTR